MYDLNDEQTAAVTESSPVIMVNAAAGSGKTKSLTSKIRQIIDLGNSPESVLAITFTNKAANEMKSRLMLTNGNMVKSMQISTFHSMCVGIMKKFIQYTPLKVPFSIYDDDEQYSIINSILKSMNTNYTVADAMRYIDSLKSADELPVDYDKTLFDRYNNILIKNNACDFNDLLIYALKCLKHKDCQEYYQNTWKHVLVDEFQDTNKIQFEIINLLYNSEKTKTLWVVGDPNQSIYLFRNARPENMKDFISMYNPTIHNLTYNYRSCPEIISYANAFLQYGKPMVAKSSKIGMVSLSVFRNQEDEADKIAEAILKMGDYEETAILYRINARSLLFERALGRYRIPYKVVGSMPYFKRRVVKDLMAFLKASNNLSDIESLARIVNVPKRGFGDSKKEKLFMEGRPYLEGLSQSMPPIADFVSLLNRIKGQSPFTAISDILNSTGYMKHLDKESDITMLESFMNISAGFKTVEDLILYSTSLEEDSGKGVKLMTAHASKGLEFNRVFVVGMEDQMWPHHLSNNLEEESRLFYVSCTRAKYYLNISYAKSKLFRGAPVETTSSVLFKKAYKQLYGKDL